MKMTKNPKTQKLIKNHQKTDQKLTILPYKTPLRKPGLSTGQEPRKPPKPQNPKSKWQFVGAKTLDCKKTKK
jgi:hypothetical protein